MRVKWWLLPVLLMLHMLTTHGFEDLADDDFAEFETFPSDDNEVIKPKEILDDFEDDNIEIKSEDEEFPTSQDSEDEIVEEDDNEFEHFQDTEEFEGYQDAPPRPAEPDLKISKVPITHRQRWDAYWLEGILCCLLAAYALVYAVGRSKNTSIAEEFLREHRQLLEDNFTLVGETGSDVVAADGARGWRREAEHVFTMWCSGRLGCEGVLLTLRLNKRQDLMHVILGLFRPAADVLLVRAELPRDDADPCVLAVGQKKIVAKMAKEMQDLSVFCAERRAADRPGLPAALAVVAECAETAGVLDARACAALAQCAPRVHYVHVSDRYAGPKVVDEQAGTKPPETERVLLASFAAEDARPLLLLTLHLVDRVKRHRLSKEALAKCEKRRQKVAEAWQRGAHAARQEQAAARREEKRKQEKEKILAEDDPEKQRRWELKEQKRQQKRKTPKMKQLKVKAL